MHCPDNPTGRIQWPGLFATVLVLVFASFGHVFFTVAAGGHPSLTTLLLASTILGYIPLDLGKPDASQRKVRVVAHARVNRLPRHWIAS
jgi:hypothetical protein